MERPGDPVREVGMGLTREGDGGEVEGDGDLLQSSGGEGDLTLYIGDLSLGDVWMGDCDRPRASGDTSLAGDPSPTIESMEKPSLPLPLEAARRLWEDLAESVAERMEWGGLVE